MSTSHWTALGAFSGGLVGGFLGSGLLGVMTVQSVRYFEVFGKKDRMVNKLAVATMCFLQYFSLACLFVGLYWVLVGGVKGAVVMRYLQWGFVSPRIATILSETIVLGYFIRTSHSLAKSWKLTAFQVTALVAQNGLSLSFTAKVYSQNSNMGTVLEQFSWTFFASAGLSMFTTVVVCSTMCFFLLRNRTGNQLGDAVIVRIVSHVVPSCVFLVLWQIANSLSLLLRSSFGFMITANPFGLLYGVTFLSTLHARSELSTQSRLAQPSSPDGVRKTKRPDAFMGFGISVVTEVHHETVDAGSREIQLQTRLTTRFPIEEEQMIVQEGVDEAESSSPPKSPNPDTICPIVASIMPRALSIRRVDDPSSHDPGPGTPMEQMQSRKSAVSDDDDNVNATSLDEKDIVELFVAC